MALVTTHSLDAVAESGATGVGDGGHGVICDLYSSTRDYRSSHFSLDLFELRFRYFTQPDLGLGPQSLMQSPRHQQSIDVVRKQILEAFVTVRTRAVSALGTDHPFVAVLNDFRSIQYSAILESRVSWTGDAGEMKGWFDLQCEIVQLAKRIDYADGPRVYLNMGHWTHLPVADRFAILLHETLHAWFADYNSTTAALRQAVMYLSAPDKFRTKNLKQFRKLIETRRPVHFRS